MSDIEKKIEQSLLRRIAARLLPQGAKANTILRHSDKGPYWGEAPSTSPLTTKGDLMSHDGSALVRLPAGTDGSILVADSGETAGIGWAASLSGTSRAGMIVAYAGASAPAGWLLCQGQELAQADYPDLYAAIGTTWDTARNQSTGVAYSAPSAGNFRVPDLRGVFLRGAGTSDGYAATTLGATQDDATAKNGLTNSTSSVSVSGNKNQFDSNQSSSGGHSHTPSNGWSFVANGTGGAGANISTGGGGYVVNSTTNTAGAHTHTWTGTFSATGTAQAQTISGDTETRPVNVGVNYIIKLWNDAADSVGGTTLTVPELQDGLSSILPNQGSLLVKGTSTVEELAIGSAGQVLTSDGSGVLSWTTPGGGVTLPTEMSDTEATALGHKTYVHNGTYNGSNAPSVTYQLWNGTAFGSSTSFVSIRNSYFIPYQMDDGTWRLKFSIDTNFVGPPGGGELQFAIRINGVQFDKTSTQIGQVHVMDGAFPVSASLTFGTHYTPYAGLADYSMVVNFWDGTEWWTDMVVSGDIKLSAKPTWAY